MGDRSGESYISPDVQRTALERWAAERGVELVRHDPEENVSGATMDRPIFNAIMRRIRSGESGGIVVYKLDRFARTLVGGLATCRRSATRSALRQPARGISTNRSGKIALASQPTRSRAASGRRAGPLQAVASTAATGGASA